VIPWSSLCFHREGRPLTSAGSIPGSGGGPSYRFSRVGPMSPFLFLYLTVIHCGSGLRMTSWYNLFHGTYVFCHDWRQVSSDLDGCLPKQFKECYRLVATVVQLTFVFLCVHVQGHSPRFDRFLFTPTPTPCSRSSLSHTHRSMGFYNRNFALATDSVRPSVLWFLDRPTRTRDSLLGYTICFTLNPVYAVFRSLSFSF
jgi:hypothetical protein